MMELRIYTLNKCKKGMLINEKRIPENSFRINKFSMQFWLLDILQTVFAKSLSRIISTIDKEEKNTWLNGKNDV